MPFAPPFPDDRQRRIAWRAVAICAAIGAVATTLYQASQIAAAEDRINWAALAVGQAIDWLLLLALLPAIVRLTRWMPVVGARWPLALAAHAAADAVLALVKMTIFVAIGEAMRASGWSFIDTVTGSMEHNFLAIAAVTCLVHLVAIRAADPPRAGQPLPDHFTVRDSRGYRLVRPAEIIWAEAQGNYAQLHTASGRHLIRSTMASLEAMLDPARFVRVHRRAIVGTDHVARIDREAGGYTLRLADGTALRGGRAYGDRIARLL